MRIPICSPCISIHKAPSWSILEVISTSIPIVFKTSCKNFSQASFVLSCTSESFSSLLTGSFTCSFLTCTSFFTSLCDSTVSLAFSICCSNEGFTSSTSSLTSSTGSSTTFFQALITACLLPIPKKPVLPFSITSYSSSLLVTPSWILASVIASLTFFADTLISFILNPPWHSYLSKNKNFGLAYFLFLLKSLTIFAFDAKLPGFAFCL